MAAEIFVGAIAESLLNKIISLAADEFSLVLGVKNRLESIANELKIIQALIVDADNKDLHSKAMELWLTTLKAVATDADDMLEDYTYEVLRLEVKMQQQRWDKVHGFFSPLEKLVFRLKIAQKIKKINVRLKRVKNIGMGYGLSPSLFLNRSSEVKVHRVTSPSVQENEIVGRDEDVVKVVDMLMNPNTEEDFSVIGIVGMGGKGKTALAQLVYKNDEVVNHFEHRMWICVSEEFKVERLLNEMVQSVTRTNSSLTNLEALVKKLQELLKDRRYLLVLDDVWNEDPEKWQLMKNELREIGGSRGSKIMVTTRSNRVVSTLHASCTHYLSNLPYDHSWHLFRRRAFAKGGAMETPEFVAVGQRVVRRCQGVPLAVKALGGLLYSKKDVREWLSIENSDIWSSTNTEDGVLSSIKLTYNHLPSLSLRQCFAYSAIFPKDTLIDREQLIQLWVAQGFLNPPEGSSLQMEDLGKNYFDILLWNSLLQEPACDDRDKVRFFKMHDIVHDFALHISKEYCFTMKVGEYYNDAKGVHLSLICSEGKMVEVPRGIPRTLRTLYLPKGVIGSMMTEFRYLRSLILCDHGIRQLPCSIGRLKHLRCMDVERTGIKALPASYTKLYSLQTLRADLRHSSTLFLGTLVKLRHVHLRHSVQCKLAGIRKLVHLQSIPYFIVSDESGCRIEELGPLNNLRGKLVIYGLDKVKSGEEASKANLSEKSKVDHIELHWSRRREAWNDEEVLEGLRLHPYLKCLKIVNFKGSRPPSWMTSMKSSTLFHSLVEFTLEGCDSLKHLPTLGHFPSLRSLRIVGCDKLVALPKGLELCTSLEAVEIYKCAALSGVDGCGLERLPSLTTLAIGGFCEELDYFPWPHAVRKDTALAENSDNVRVDFPCLQNLTLWGWQKLTSLPNQLQHLTSLRSLKIHDFKGMTALPKWLQNIQSLRVLTLADSVNLEPMVSSEAMERMSNLQELSITISDRVKEKCIRRTDEKWMKIFFRRSLSI